MEDSGFYMCRKFYIYCKVVNETYLKTMEENKEKERLARILIVDDEETLCEALRFNIEEEGFEADVAYSAEEALALDLSSYSLFILDVMMGDISGTQLAKIIKSREDTKIHTNNLLHGPRHGAGNGRRT